MPTVDLFPVLLPVVLVLFGALVTLASEPFLARNAKHGLLPWLGALFLVAAGVAQTQAPTGQLHHLLAMDLARLWLCEAIIGAGLCAMAGLQQSLDRDEQPGGEAYALTLFSAAGAMLMVMAVDAVALFVAMELAALSVYALVGLRRDQAESQEALYKYFVMGAVFSAIFLYGVALTYGATGATAVGRPPTAGRWELLLLGQALMAIGLLFKVGAVPFHFWVPDAYTGASCAVTGFMGAALKVGGFAALGALWLNLAAVAGGTQDGVIALDAAVLITRSAREALSSFNSILLVLGLLSVVLGSFAALKQTDVRRLMGYGAIAHVGFMLLAFGLPHDDQLSLGSLWYYLVGYALATAGALTAFAAFSGRGDLRCDLVGLAGQGRDQPFLGLVLTIFLASLAGLPPTVGFLGKFLVFAGLIDKGRAVVAVFAVIMAVVGAAFYLRLVVALWAGHAREPAKASAPVLDRWILAAAAIAVLVLVIWSDALVKRAPSMMVAQATTGAR